VAYGWNTRLPHIVVPFDSTTIAVESTQASCLSQT
jgi:hypothetical protein